MRATKEAWWIIDQLVAQGVDLFCIAPGSRNSPLILAAAEHPKAKTIVHFDERGLGFYALGYGKGSKRAAAVIVTSGTAVGNLLPSIMEAHHSLIPMILLTADRPVELKSCGANQASDQVKIFSSFLRWEIDLSTDLNETQLRSLAAQAVFHTQANPPGPVQLNCPFREPFISRDRSLENGNPVTFSYPRFLTEPYQTNAKRGVILIGAIDGAIRPILDLAERIQWPVFADILSNARNNPTNEQILHFDQILKEKPAERPDFVLHFGERLTSKKILDWPVTIHIAKSPYLQDPNRTVLHRVQSDIDSFCSTFKAEVDPSWINSWKQEDEEMERKISKRFDLSPDFTESHLMRQLSHLIPPDFAIFLGNGMPIREADLFLFPQKTKGFFANRGLSGIDGNIATVAGLAEGLHGPVIAILGDQTSLHDLNSLPFFKNTRHPIILIISNNFGGGIFSHLPVSKSVHFETHIGGKHSWKFEKAAEMFEIPHFTSLQRVSFDKSCLVEIFTSRSDNYKFHNRITL